LHQLAPNELQGWANSQYIRDIANKSVYLSTKAEREFWKQVNRESLPLRSLAKDYSWGKDSTGRDLGESTIEAFQERSLKQNSLTALEVRHRSFLTKRKQAEQGVVRPNGQPVVVTEKDIEEEKIRRKDMAAMKQHLYGQHTGPYARDPEWDDVAPLPAEEPEGALAAIAYPEDYAESM
jgi:protein farnesyltransferase/geranylgeranyltransferase type-1 subunit alpha